MHPLGVHSHLFRGSPSTVAAQVARYGLACVQLTPSFPGLHFREPGQINAERCRQVSRAFNDAGVTIACLSGGVHLLEPDLDRRYRGILRFHKLIRHCQDFGTRYVVAETGDFAPAAWIELCIILDEALNVAADCGVTVLLKPGPGQALASAADAVRLRAAITRPELGFVMDAAGFLSASRPDELPCDLDTLCERVGDWTPVIHAKDLHFGPLGPIVPRVGRGALDYPRLLTLLRMRQPDAPIILEHLRAEEVPAAKAYMRSALGGSLAPAQL